MAQDSIQKVVVVNVKAGVDKGHYLEMDFPQLTEALKAGYFVKQVVPVPFTSTSTLGHTTIVFVLDSIR